MQYAIWSLLGLALISAALFAAKMWGKYQQSDEQKQEAYAKSRREWKKIISVQANAFPDAKSANDFLRSRKRK